ncbi:MAG: hypothetical protein COA38_19615 [Fluviicola sp.]|nr:MAG: hypothetical protein COA38_19615 [Fluviicola sp.]
MSSIYSGSFCLSREENKSYRFGFTIVIGNLESLLDYKYILSSNEQNELNQFKYKKRKSSFLLGRVSAKLAINQIHKEEDFQSITIGKGVFGFPIVKGVSENIQVSITHCEDVGMSLAYNEEHPISIDVEKIDTNRISLIEKYISPTEVDLLNDHCSKEMGTFMAWTSKEALSKILKTGLTLDFNIMSINKIEEIAEGIYVNTFLNFPQYKSYTFRANNMVCSIVTPEKSFFELDDVIDLKNKLKQTLEK